MASQRPEQLQVVAFVPRRLTSQCVGIDTDFHREFVIFESPASALPVLKKVASDKTEPNLSGAFERSHDVLGCFEWFIKPRSAV